ncbi:membrane-associated protein [Balnearium lithotrophicum]|uniref:Membrane-associated protein n=1 Tax=Balnearium lithotrophicum TaxID=223788 RepID=A0A521AMI2_9BACT|nr:DedA family protein [Balnearium lithotrophicum]SMO35860.1 membrane-associated protein [Balnearium lithotrophicum]
MEFSSLYSFVDKSILFIKEHPNFSCLVLFLWSFLETAFLLGLILPAEKVLLLSSFLVAKGIVSPVSYLICVSTGTFLGYEFSYFLGYFLGEEALRKLTNKFNVNEDDFERVKSFVNTKGELSLIFGRFFPIVRPLLPVVLGAFKPNYFVFSVFNGIGALLWATSYLIFGNLIEEFFSNIIRHKFLGILTVIALLSVYFFWRRYGKDKKDL